MEQGHAFHRERTDLDEVENSRARNDSGTGMPTKPQWRAAVRELNQERHKLAEQARKAAAVSKEWFDGLPDALLPLLVEMFDAFELGGDMTERVRTVEAVKLECEIFIHQARKAAVAEGKGE